MNGALVRRGDRPRPTPLTIDAGYARGRGNSIGAIRWVLASAVIYYHGYIIGGFRPNPIDHRLHLDLGATAVNGFFILSGFLMARSYASATGVIDYLRKRILRIYPAFWLCLVLTATVFARLSLTQVKGTITSRMLVTRWRYVTGNWTLHLHYPSIPGLFGNTAGSREVHALAIPNGSIWTLLYEFRCYLVLAIFGILGILWRRRAIILGLTVALGVWACTTEVALHSNPAAPGPTGLLAHVASPLGGVLGVRFLFTFLVGTCLALYQREVVLSGKVALLAGIFILGVGQWWRGAFPAVTDLPLAYLILWAGVRLPLSWWDRFGDPSYGAYLYGWPVETVAAEFGLPHLLGMTGYVATSILIATGLGYASWHGLEKRAIVLARRPLPSLGRSQVRPPSGDGTAVAAPSVEGGGPVDIAEVSDDDAHAPSTRSPEPLETAAPTRSAHADVVRSPDGVSRLDGGVESGGRPSGDVDPSGEH